MRRSKLLSAVTAALGGLFLPFLMAMLFLPAVALQRLAPGLEKEQSLLASCFPGISASA
jgi:hypothetical protein